MGTNLLLLLTACIWGFAFVAQRVGMEYVSPFGFNGIRFALGALSLLPLLIRPQRFLQQGSEPSIPHSGRFSLLKRGLIAGFLLFGGSSLQQVGIVYTTAGKAGFITGLYVVLVPLIGTIFGTRSGAYRWIGALCAAIGLYFLSVTGDFQIGRGDFLVFLSAFFFAFHVLYLSRVSPLHDPIPLSILQYGVVSLLSMGTALFTETLEIDSFISAWLPILYGGIFSVGIAYSLQVIAQKKAHPTHAAILLSMEGLFAALGGALLLHETFTLRETFGALLMLGGMILGQWER